jgi:lipopolysaccharide/colanic/teichoic acid biosynthesis glycosyltransferase
MRADTPVIAENEHLAGLFRDRQNPARPARRAARGTIPRWKRSLDLTCILLTLPFWLPVMLLIMCLIKLVSPGPVFFRQERIGYKGRRFRILKFRSMKVDAETRSHEGHLEKLIKSDRPMTKLDATGDPRLIPFGAILRASGLDELPQLFNVLRGDMSLVGPRPCTPHEFRQYEPWQRERVNAQPGLTGYWQVNGKNRTTFTEMIAMDIYYCCCMTLWLDLWIMIKTIPAILVQMLETRAARRAAAKEASAVFSTVSGSAEG